MKYLRGTQFHSGPVRQKFPEYPVQRGLGSGTEHGGDTIALHQLGNGKHTGTKTGDRQHLRLVKNNDALGQIVQLTALGRTVGKERLKELYRRGHHHRHIPVFSRSGQSAVLRPGFILNVVQDTGMMLQYILLPKNIPKDLGVLLDNGGIRDHIDDPAQAVGPGVAQGKGQRSHRLAASSGDGKGEQSRGEGLPLFHAVLQHCAPFPVQFRFGREPARDIRLEFALQHLHRVPAAPVLFFSRHKGLCVQKIRINQTGIKHPGKKHFLRPAGKRRL